MQEIYIDLMTHPYSVYIEEGLLDHMGKYIQSEKKYDKIMVVTDRHVESLYLKRVINALQVDGSQVDVFVIEPGEVSKSFTVAANIASTLARKLYSRKDLILTLGGGVVGDLGGFVAATYMRGIDYMQCPTTLLAQIDSSVGGKVAINIPEGKNLVGSFYQPKKVFIDPNVLSTLSDDEIRSGLGEMIKYGCIEDSELFGQLEDLQIEDLPDYYPQLIARCVAIKKHYVVNDEKEKHLRMHLNYGHTIGHAIEKASHYKISHGQAVAMGIYYMVKAQVKSGQLPEEDLVRITALLDRYGMLSRESYPTKTLMDFISHDKKASAEYINIVLLNHIGSSRINQMHLEAFEAFLEEINYENN